MSKHNVVEMSGRDRSRNELTELIPDGARKLINEALEAEANCQRPERIVSSRSELYHPNGRFGSLAALLIDSSLMAAFACKLDVPRADFGSLRNNVRFSRKRSFRSLGIERN